MDIEQLSHIRQFRKDYRWDGVAHLPYKEEGAAPFKAISRQVLFHEPDQGCELRYFEMDAGGFSTLERHEHMHAVMILRGRGQCQFRATEGEPFGFMCMVNAERDKPQLPNAQELETLRRRPAIAAFLES